MDLECDALKLQLMRESGNSFIVEDGNIHAARKLCKGILSVHFWSIYLRKSSSSSCITTYFHFSHLRYKYSQTDIITNGILLPNNQVGEFVIPYRLRGSYILSLTLTGWLAGKFLFITHPLNFNPKRANGRTPRAIHIHKHREDDHDIGCGGVKRRYFERQTKPWKGYKAVYYIEVDNNVAVSGRRRVNSQVIPSTGHLKFGSKRMKEFRKKQLRPQAKVCSMSFYGSFRN